VDSNNVETRYSLLDIHLSV